MKRILAAIDGSAGSEKALDFAADLAAKCEADLILLMVATDFSAVTDTAYKAWARTEHFQAGASELALADAQAALVDARVRAETRGVKQTSTEATLGDPAQQIISYAKDRQADLVVVGSRGHGQLVGLLIGSVAQKVISHAVCPVVVVR